MNLTVKRAQSFLEKGRSDISKNKNCKKKKIIPVSCVVENALDLEIDQDKPVLFPVRIDDTVMKSKADWAGAIKEKHHIGDFTRWKERDEYSKAFERLLRDLKAR